MTEILFAESPSVFSWSILGRVSSSTVFLQSGYGRGGQTAAREPHAALRTFACGSLSFPKNYIFGFYFLFLLQSVEIL